MRIRGVLTFTFPFVWSVIFDFLVCGLRSKWECLPHCCCWLWFLQEFLCFITLHMDGFQFESWSSFTRSCYREVASGLCCFVSNSWISFHFPRAYLPGCVTKIQKPKWPAHSLLFKNKFVHCRKIFCITIQFFLANHQDNRLDMNCGLDCCISFMTWLPLQASLKLACVKQWQQYIVQQQTPAMLTTNPLTRSWVHSLLWKGPKGHWLGVLKCRVATSAWILSLEWKCSTDWPKIKVNRRLKELSVHRQPHSNRCRSIFMFLVKSVVTSVKQILNSYQDRDRRTQAADQHLDISVVPYSNVFISTASAWFACIVIHPHSDRWTIYKLW